MSTALLAAPGAAPAITPAPAVKAAAPRRAMLDVVRLVAAYSIVWLHTPRAPELAPLVGLGRFAVPLFVMAAVLMTFESVRRRPELGWGGYLRGRFWRLYVPFLAWSGVYLAFKAVKSLALPEQPNEFPGVELLLVGGFYHLWFMPFILVVTVLAFGVAKLVEGRDQAARRAAWGAALGGTALALMAGDSAATLVGEYGRLLIDALPAVAWGIAVAIPWTRGELDWLQRPRVALLAFALAVASLAWVVLVGRAPLAETLAGLGLLVVGLSPWRGAPLDALARFGPLSYGVYLGHLLWIKTFEALLARAGWPVDPTTDVVVFLLSAAGSTLVAWALSRTPLTRWLVA